MSANEAEDLLTAELDQLGVSYLSFQPVHLAVAVRPPHHLLADLMKQPSSRVRTAVIAVLLTHPEYADAIRGAIAELPPEPGLTLKLFYTAAVLLQQKHADRLQPLVGDRWRSLPDWFSAELALPPTLPVGEALARLGERHRALTGVMANWSGTYENVVHHLLRRWELAKCWNRSQPQP